MSFPQVIDAADISDSPPVGTSNPGKFPHSDSSTCNVTLLLAIFISSSVSRSWEASVSNDITDLRRELYEHDELSEFTFHSFTVFINTCSFYY